MDRRDFIKGVVASSALAPLLLSLRGEDKAGDTADALYLLSETPQACLPRLLEDLYGQGIIRARHIDLGRHPWAEDLAAALGSWKVVSRSERTDVVLRFESLLEAHRPSFTLVRNGRLVDWRKDNWLELWQRMGADERTRRLTIASFSNRREAAGLTGEAAVISIGGRIIDRISLKENGLRIYPGRTGRLYVRVKRGALRVEEAGCRHQICVMTPAASRPGDRILCAPNRFLAEVEGRRAWDTMIG